MPETGEWHSQPGHIFQGWLVAERRRRARCSHTTQPAPGGPSSRPPGSRRCPQSVPEVPPQARPGAFPPLCILHLVLPRARLSPRTHSTHPGAPTQGLPPMPDPQVKHPSPSLPPLYHSHHFLTALLNNSQLFKPCFGQGCKAGDVQSGV